MFNFRRSMAIWGNFRQSHFKQQRGKYPLLLRRLIFYYDSNLLGWGIAFEQVEWCLKITARLLKAPLIEIWCFLEGNLFWEPQGGQRGKGRIEDERVFTHTIWDYIRFEVKCDPLVRTIPTDLMKWFLPTFWQGTIENNFGWQCAN